MAGRRWKPGNPHVEFRCRYCSGLLGVGMVIQGGVATSSTANYGDGNRHRRGWVCPPAEFEVYNQATVFACLKHNTVVGGIIDAETGSSTHRYRITWEDVLPAIAAFDEGRVGVVRLGPDVAEGVTITGTHNDVRASLGITRHREPDHPRKLGSLSFFADQDEQRRSDSDHPQHEDDAAL